MRSLRSSSAFQDSCEIIPFFVRRHEVPLVRDDDQPLPPLKREGRDFASCSETLREASSTKWSRPHSPCFESRSILRTFRADPQLNAFDESPCGINELEDAPPPSSTSISTPSRVVPAMSLAKRRSALISLLISDDLPAFVRPTTATLTRPPSHSIITTGRSSSSGATSIPTRLSGSTHSGAGNLSTRCS